MFRIKRAHAKLINNTDYIDCVDSVGVLSKMEDVNSGRRIVQSIVVIVFFVHKVFS